MALTFGHLEVDVRLAPPIHHLRPVELGLLVRVGHDGGAKLSGPDADFDVGVHLPGPVLMKTSKKTTTKNGNHVPLRSGTQPPAN